MNAKGNTCEVQPIRDLNKLNDMKEFLLSRNERDYLLFVLGINSGLRVSDLLKLTVEEVKTGVVVIREQKTQKVKQFALSDTCKQAIDTYLKNTGITSGTLFPSRKDSKTPITARHVWRILKEAADWCGITDNIGTHTMRKTFGFHAFKKGVDIYYIMKCLNHSTPAITKRYIGIEQEELDDVVYKNMDL